MSEYVRHHARGLSNRLANVIESHWNLRIKAYALFMHETWLLFMNNSKPVLIQLFVKLKIDNFTFFTIQRPTNVHCEIIYLPAGSVSLYMCIYYQYYSVPQLKILRLFEWKHLKGSRPLRYMKLNFSFPAHKRLFKDDWWVKTQSRRCYWRSVRKLFLYELHENSYAKTAVLA